MSFSARQLMREKESVYQELGLADDKWSEDALVDVMLANPILINRPIVVTPLGTKLCRPSELVLEILPSAQRGEFRKEDGELVIDADGKRV
jgi:arsenate reductase